MQNQQKYSDEINIQFKDIIKLFKSLIRFIEALI
jgi:hypothetical protein